MESSSYSEVEALAVARCPDPKRAPTSLGPYFPPSRSPRRKPALRQNGSRQPRSPAPGAQSPRDPGRAGLPPASRPRAHPPGGAEPLAGDSRLPPARPGTAGSIAASEARVPGRVPAEAGLSRPEVLRQLVSGPPTVLSPLPTEAAAAEVPETQPRGAGHRVRAGRAGRPAEVKLLAGLLGAPF